MTDAHTVRYRAPAKINIGLEIVGRRDDGYHDLVTIFQTVGLYDTVTVRRASHMSMTATGLAVPTDETNLCLRAARAYFEAAGESGGCQLALHKDIPIGAGLGGGSSDAASTLRALDRLFGHEVDLHEIAEGIGSDVPFFLHGGTALGEGRGEKLTPAPRPVSAHVLLAKPEVNVNTAHAYSLLTPEDYSSGEKTRRLFERLSGGAAPGEEADLITNGFQNVIEKVYPPVRKLREHIEATEAAAVVMSGSGSCVFGLFDQMAAAETAANELQRRGYWSLATNLV
ncbi:MAG: 4-(cytidine 5'-diphospho)-2-C-methyl-D-erythritol kinase [Armatimonadota bacterium]